MILMFSTCCSVPQGIKCVRQVMNALCTCKFFMQRFLCLQLERLSNGPEALTKSAFLFFTVPYEEVYHLIMTFSLSWLYAYIFQQPLQCPRE